MCEKILYATRSRCGYHNVFFKKRKKNTTLQLNEVLPAKEESSMIVHCFFLLHPMCFAFYQHRFAFMIWLLMWLNTSRASRFEKKIIVKLPKAKQNRQIGKNILKMLLPTILT